MVKLIIIEGQDRCGKDLLISKLAKHYNTPLVIHWGYPQGDTNEDKTKWQQESFSENFKMWSHNIDFSANPTNYAFYWNHMIWNRSHLGEYVYGTLYRDSKPETWVPTLEKLYLKDAANVYLILLTADAEFIVGQDDGNSYSNKLQDKTNEQAAFINAVNNSSISNKKIIKVNDKSGYIDTNIILEQAINFINGQ